MVSTIYFVPNDIICPSLVHMTLQLMNLVYLSLLRECTQYWFKLGNVLLDPFFSQDLCNIYMPIIFDEVYGNLYRFCSFSCVL